MDQENVEKTKKRDKYKHVTKMIDGKKATTEKVYVKREILPGFKWDKKWG